jgi:hypothetical protein
MRGRVVFVRKFDRHIENSPGIEVVWRLGYGLVNFVVAAVVTAGIMGSFGYADRRRRLEYQGRSVDVIARERMP